MRYHIGDSVFIPSGGPHLPNMIASFDVLLTLILVIFYSRSLPRPSPRSFGPVWDDLFGLYMIIALLMPSRTIPFCAEFQAAGTS